MKIKQIIFHNLKDEFIRHAGIMFICTALCAIFDLCYHLFAVRKLSIEDYGTFNTLVSLVAFLFIAISPLHVTLTKYFAKDIAKKNFSKVIFIFKNIVAQLLIISLAIFILFYFLSQTIAVFFNTEADYILICAGILALALFYIPFLSIIQGFQKFTMFSLIWSSSTLGKLILGVVLMYMGQKVLGGLLGFMFAPVLVILLSSILLYRIYVKEIRPIEKKDYSLNVLIPIYKFIWPSFLAMLSFALLTSSSMGLVKHFFSASDAGFYSIAQIIGKINLLLPAAVAVVILPKSAVVSLNQKLSLKLLYKALFLGGGCCLVFILLVFIFPEFILVTLTGKVNPESKALIGLFSLITSFHALLWIIINYSLGINKLKFIIPIFFAAVLEVISICVFHQSLHAVLWILLFFSIVAFSGSFLLTIPINIKGEL